MGLVLEVPFAGQMVISGSADGANSVFAADMDGDGDLDVLSASRNDDKIAWYKNTAGNGLAWTIHTISTATDSPRSVFTADVDGDGDVDVLSASISANQISWYKNTAGNGSVWTTHTITTNADGANSVYAKDMDGDGDADVLSASVGDDKIAWYENTAGNGTAWTTHTLSTNAGNAASVYAADMDGDGDVDALSASQLDDKIAWYPNQGGQFGLATTDTAPATIIQGQADDLLRINAGHNGRSGDNDAELVTFELLFEQSTGSPLSTTEANNLLQSLSVTDPDSMDLGSATVTLTNRQNGTSEILTASTTGTGIVSVYNPANGVLSLLGTDSLGNYELVLSSVTYDNSAEEPGASARIIEFVGQDSSGNNSATATSTVSITLVNDPPVLDLDGDNSGGVGGSDYQTAFVQGSGAVAITDSDLVLTDADNTELVSATVAITNRQDGAAEILSATTSGTAITAQFINGVLILTGTDSVMNYQQVLASVTYNNSATPPNATPRVVTFTVNDGVANSNTATSTISIQVTTGGIFSDGFESGDVSGWSSSVP